ncbi:MAG: formylmethanofuran dehydrogenase [Chloroflexi bacterium]|nr:MAG: formylmethanofuran dehydrogenase [Chloroflexota bacterium]
MPSLEELLAQSAALHNHLCPRQVLGVRMGLWAAQLLDLRLPQTDKRLLTLVETDGCFVDGVSVATNCWVGRRTLRVEDYGKVAATFVDSQTGAAWRVTPRAAARDLARTYAPEATNRWQAMLLGYQRMPTTDLLAAQRVRLVMPVERIVSRPGYRALCSRCGEEIMNERDVEQDGVRLCRACAGHAYYCALPPDRPDET